MKAKLVLLTALLCLAGCSLMSSPTASAKQFIASAEKGDVETMNSLFSTKAVQTMGVEKIRSNNQVFSDMVRKAIAGGTKPKISQLRETVIGDSASVSLLYSDDERKTSIGLGFDLTKENGAWKIFHIGSRESGDLGETGASPEEPKSLVFPSPVPPPKETTEPLSPPTVTDPLSPEMPPKKTGVLISAGVLNGKAISLPKPVYPPVAKAAHASGTVVIKVVVDEEGNVTEAHAVSGHPLLQAAAIAAARNAKFAPTKLSGQPVKVSGIINYNFTAE